jgi:signal transduction histidine kinase
VTPIEHDGEVIAALVHDPSLQEERQLVHAVGAAAHLALENARLQAELRAQLALVEESRARIVAAGDEERRRIERDLHDGAQQRLVAMAIGLRTAQTPARRRPRPRSRTAALGHGRPPGGGAGAARARERDPPDDPGRRELAAGLDSLAARSPVPVAVTAPSEPFAPEVEADAYFIACEALANVAKHAGATSATLTASRDQGALVIE